MVKILQNYITQNDGYKKNGSLLPKGIMIHSTATPGIMAQEFHDRFDKPNLGKSIHAFIDDTVCIQCLPWDKKAGHCLLSGNDTHIGIEMCEPREWTTDDAYFKRVYQNAVDISVYLCKLYGITAENVISHAEGYQKGIASNHADVGHWFPYFNKDMNDFRAAVRQGLNERAISKELQTVLNAAYNTELVVDGIIGNKTTAVISSHHLFYIEGAMIRNIYVKWVQGRLISKAYNCGKTGADGIYGKNTKSAVVAFQKENGLSQDGIVGIKTITAIVE